MPLSLTSTAIPDLEQLRAVKDSYPGVAIDREHTLYDEPVVSLWDYGIEGSSYYSGPNKATGDPLPGVRPEPLVRRSVAEKLVVVKQRIWDDEELTRHLDGRGTLVIKDALRSYGLQKHLFEIVWPTILREANPDWDDERLHVEVRKVVGQPKDTAESPTPHMTGGAVDVDIVHEDGSSVNFGHVRGSTLVSQTDYHEARTHNREVPIDPYARLVRRALYWSMLEQGFTNHPYEFWHYSFGDQMWALYSGESAAFYGAVNGAPDLH